MFRSMSERHRAAVAAATNSPAPTSSVAPRAVAAPAARLEGDRLVVEGPRIVDVLAVVHQHLGTDAALLRTDRTIVGGVLGFFGREHFVVEADATGIVSGTPAGTGVVGADASVHVLVEPVGPVEASGHDFAAHLARALSEAEPGGPSDEELVERLRGLQVDDPAPSISSAPVAQPVTPDQPIAAAEPITHAQPVAAAPSPETDARLMLLALAARELDPRELAGRVDALRAAPPTPVERGIVAVVGERDEALAVAGRLIVSDGGSVEDVVVVSADAPADHPAWMWVGSPDEAAARRDRWNRRGTRCVVAVLLPPGDEARRWARAVLDALAPAEVRLAVPGWRTADELVTRRVHGLAPVDGIDLVGAVEPGSALGFLALHVPVLTFDGDPATAPAWAELLASTPTGRIGGSGSPLAASPVADAPVTRDASDPALR